ncbi:MAG: SpvB/TcaC N-terminal domain-containing protein [Caldilineaceae bacterium]
MFQADVRQPHNRASAGSSAVRAASPAPEMDGGSPSTSLPAIPSISLLKGGGAIRGMGEKFAANPVTGTGSMTVPIATSPGRSGFGPQLALSYDSGSGNGPFGFGWSLALPAITRKTDKGLPRYNDAAESDVFILSGAEDLVPEFARDDNGAYIMKDGQPAIHEEPRTVNGVTYTVRRYRPRTEGLFARIERWQHEDNVHWRSFAKDNILTIYGQDENSRIFDPAAPSHIFSWLICESRDDKGNAILYEYKAENGDGVDLAQAHERNRGDRNHPSRAANRYLKQIRYGNRTTLLDEQGNRPLCLAELPEPQVQNVDWLFRVVFDYGEHNAATPTPDQERPWEFRADPFSSYRAGFEIRTTRLCQRVLMFHDFPNEAGVGANCLVRSTDFTYAYEQNADSVRDPIFSFLHEVTQTGYVRQSAGDYRKKSLPPLVFEYSKVPTPAELAQLPVQTVDATSLENLPVGLDGANYQWVDLDGEGISGILTEQADVWFYKRNLSPKPLAGENGSQSVTARFAPLELVATKPSTSLAGHAQLLDLAGDGRVDLVQMDGPVRGFYERTAEAGWVTFRPFVAWPNVDTRDPNLKFVDLDGDGHADILIAEDDVFTWHASLAEAGFGPAQRVTQPPDEEKGPRLLFADGTQSIYLSDMSGDGLTDLARIRNGEICYWPNLGYGRFGAKVTMDNAPWFDQPDQFNQQRIRLADVDGSGTTDILYLGRNRVDLYRNQSGNGWGSAEAIPFPQVDNLASVMALDLLGNGTACLVWSSPLPGAAGCPMCYIDLMNGGKPHVLVRSVNNLGAETRVAYAPSTKFYLQDKFAGKPWITRLPFPVHVVERVESYDHISRNRFVTRYAYHHGYFDGEEREFRGFGMVEQWDTEEIGKLLPAGTPPTAANLDQASFVPPVLTKTWFHTGVYLGRNHISDFFAGLLDAQDQGEYYREPLWRNNDIEARKRLLDDTILPAGLTVDEEREACRALKGSMLRQETFALDGTSKAEHPYTVTEQNFEIRMVQLRGDNRHAVFFTHPREAITYHYERNPADPRVSHALTLQVDQYGNVLRSISVGYPRANVAGRQLEQNETHVTLTLNRIANVDNQPDWYRIGVPAETRTYELVKPPTPTLRYTWEELSALVTALVPLAQIEPPIAKTIPYEQWDWRKGWNQQNEPGGLINSRLRLIEHVRTIYRSDDLQSILDLGTVGALALPYESYKLAFTLELAKQLFVASGKLAEAGLTALSTTEGGYVHIENGTKWWIPSGRIFYGPTAQELDEARTHFFLPRRFRDPFGNETTVAYDGYDLLVAKTVDALQNSVQAANDYRVLQPKLVTDPNVNRSEVAFDALGMVVGTAVMGKVGENKGDLIDATFLPDLDDSTVSAHINQPLIDPYDILQKATTRLVYDLFAYQHTKDDPQPQPAIVYTLARETHHFDLAPGAQTKVQHSFSYSDGFGREIQKKIQAEPGSAPQRDHAGKMITNAAGQPEMTTTDVTPRWVGSGWTIFNNKGKPVRQYEPFFTDTHRFEFDAQIGVSPVLFYDPVERVVATLHPNHTYEKVLFDPWQQATWDVNDTVLNDPRTDEDVKGYTAGYFKTQPATWQTWYAQRIGKPVGDPEHNAAQKTAVHANTPTKAYFDTLGRAVVTIADNGAAGQYTTRTELDMEGNQRSVTDANNRIVMRYAYDLLGNRIHQASMEAGARWLLNDVTGKAIRTWDSRGFMRRLTYDALRRPSGLFVTENGVERLAERTIYGEGQGVTNNQRTRVYQVFDGTGIVTNEAYDFKGNLLRSKRALLADYKQGVNWAQNPSVNPGDFTTSTTYDVLNRPLTVTSPDNSVYRPTFNEANLLEKVAVNLCGAATATPFVIDIDYDAKGQRTLIEYGNGVRTEYEYDPLTFRLVHLLTRRNAATFPNDCPQPPPTGWLGCQVQNLHYTYDPVGNITYIRDDAQQTIYFKNQRVEPSADYTYDALYRLIEATGREHLGQVGGSPIPHSYNDAPRVGIRSPGPDNGFHPHDGNAMGRYCEKYIYDAVGNFQEMSHQRSSADTPSWKRTYTYNEASLTEPGNPTEPGKKSNRLSSTQVGSGPTAAPESYTYDAHGNMLHMPHLQIMQWDFEDQLQMTQRQAVNAADTDGVQHQGERTYYVYDAAGQRVRKVTELANGNLKDERIYLGGFEIYRQHAGSNAGLVRETLHIMDDKQRIALVETKTLPKPLPPSKPEELIRYQFGNHLGSASLELDDQAQIISYEEYYPYGSTSYQAARCQTETPKRYHYIGKERDEESGLYYYGARYYAPWLGRWICCDPLMGTIRKSMDFNRYLYTNANPCVYVDPDGRIATLALAGIGALVGGIGGAALGAWRAKPGERWAGAAKGAAIGAGTGALAGLTAGISLAATTGVAVVGGTATSGSVLISGTLAGAVGGGTSAAATTLSEGGTWQDALVMASMGAFTGSIGGAVGGGTGAVTTQLAKSAGASLLARQTAGGVVAGATGDAAVQSASIASGLQEKFSPAELGFSTILGGTGGGISAKLMAAKGPGILGKQATRDQLNAIAAELERRGYTITGGGDRLPEEYLPGPGGGRKGSSHVDITATKNGRTLRVNTIDTLADGVTPDKREAGNAARIRAQTGGHLLLIPKKDK